MTFLNGRAIVSTGSTPIVFNTRIAPSPTGDMHIGTARTAYFNWLAARASGGKFLLRIDDTDQKRNNPEYTKVILDTMKWLGLDYDDLVYQSSRFERYRERAAHLVSQGYAIEKDGAIMLSIPEDILNNFRKILTSWSDWNIGDDIPITEDDYSHINGSVIIKSDGSPAYNFASVVDDMDLKTTLILRGVDHITNTSKQVVIFAMLGPEYLSTYEVLPKFAHLGLICVKGKPMSKREGAASMLHYMNAGYDPDAMLNFLARLGWGPTVDDKTTALLSREKMLELFLTSGKMKNQNAGFDLGKLESFDRKYKAKKGVWRNGDSLL